MQAAGLWCGQVLFDSSFQGLDTAECGDVEAVYVAGEIVAKGEKVTSQRG
jgi:hypothetical protein